MTTARRRPADARTFAGSPWDSGACRPKPSSSRSPKPSSSRTTASSRSCSSAAAAARCGTAPVTRYLDMTAGIAVCGLGHAHPAFTARVTEQLDQARPRLEPLLQRPADPRREGDHRALVRQARVLLQLRRARRTRARSSSRGATRRSSRARRSARRSCSTNGSFHGRVVRDRRRSPASRSTARASARSFGPVEFVAVRRPRGRGARCSSQRTACAIIVEPIQAEGGIIVAPPGYLAGLRRLCDDTGTILIFDEVQTGVGRTGKWFGHQHDDVAPDVMTLAKGLGGGVPIGAVACSEKAAAGLAAQPGGAVPHASTFGGNPLACAAALAVFDIMETEGLSSASPRPAQYLGERLARARRASSRATRSRRAAAACCAASPSRARRRRSTRSAARRACSCRSPAPTSCGFAPPYIVERAQLDEAVSHPPRRARRGRRQGAMSVTRQRLPHARRRAGSRSGPRCGTAPRASSSEPRCTTHARRQDGRARVREGVDAHARVVRGRRVRARRPRGRAVVAGQPDRARRADRGHGARPVAATATRSCCARSARSASRRSRAAATVPVINGLSDQHHPCQVATDLFTVARAARPRSTACATRGSATATTWPHSWIEAAGMFGLDLVLACPEGFAPDPRSSRPRAPRRPARRRLDRRSTRDPREAAAGAHVLSTDVWASMGQEDEAAARRAAFAGFCVDARAAAARRAGRDRAALPAGAPRRGDHRRRARGPRSLAWEQAENRLHVGKAILEHVPGRRRPR